MADQDEQLTSLIGGIYDAALDPALWTGQLRQVATFVGGMDASLIAKYSAGADASVFYSSGGVTTEWRQRYVDYYHAIDPTSAGQFSAPVGVPAGGAELVGYDELFASRFYREWATPQGIVDGLSVTLDKAATTIVLSVIMRGQEHGLVDDEARRRLALVAPHQRRAMFVNRTLEARAAEADALADACDNLASAMFLLGADCRIAFANRSAAQLLEARRHVGQESAGRLRVMNPHAARALDDAILRAAAGDAALGLGGIAIPLPAEGQADLIAHVLPLTSGERRRAGARYASVAALFIRTADREGLAPQEVIAKAYGLTPAELRVLLAFSELKGIDEAAARLGISDNTVRTHLKRVYAKTGASRQADLVKLKQRFER